MAALIRQSQSVKLLQEITDPIHQVQNVDDLECLQRTASATDGEARQVLVSAGVRLDSSFHITAIAAASTTSTTATAVAAASGAKELYPRDEVFLEELEVTKDQVVVARKTRILATKIVQQTCKVM